MFDFHSNYFGPDPKIMAYLNVYMKTQDMVLSMAVIDIPSVVERVISSVFMKDEFGMEEFVHMVCSSIEFRLKQIPIIAEMMLRVASSDKINKEMFKEKILNEIIMDANDSARRKNAYRVLRILISKGLFSFEPLLERIKNLSHGYPYFDLILFFLDMIPPEQVEEMKQRKFPKMSAHSNALDMIDKMDELLENNAEILKQYIQFGHRKDSAEYAIIIDDVNLLKQRYKKSEYSLTQSKENPFSYYLFSELQFALHIGSVKCAKYLASLSTKKSPNYEKIAIGASSSSEIVELMSKKPAQESLEGCSISHDWVFMEWLYERSGLTKKHSSGLLFKSAIDNFPRGVLLALSVTECNTNDGDVTGMNALFWAIKNRNYVISMIIASDPRVDIVVLRKDENTILHYASKMKWPGLLQILLEKGADPNHKNNNGNTPVHNAAKKGSLECVKLMIKFGGRTATKNKKQFRPIDVAKNPQVIEFLKEADAQEQ